MAKTDRRARACSQGLGSEPAPRRVYRAACDGTSRLRSPGAGVCMTGATSGDAHLLACIHGVGLERRPDGGAR